MTATQLPERPNLEQLKRQAKDLLRSARANDPAALARFRILAAFGGMSEADLARRTLALHDAQSVIAREHGFESWNVLRERVEELTLEFGGAVERVQPARGHPRGRAGCGGPRGVAALRAAPTDRPGAGSHSPTVWCASR